jgi:hypothetical protein
MTPKRLQDPKKGNTRHPKKATPRHPKKATPTMASSSEVVCNIEKKWARERLRIARKRSNPACRDAERIRARCDANSKMRMRRGEMLGKGNATT